MSTSYSAALVYGLTFKDAIRLEDELGLASILDMIYEDELEVFPPYYDAPYEDSVVGVVIVQTGSYNFKEVSLSDFSEAKKERLALAKLFGEDNLNFYLTTVGR